MVQISRKEFELLVERSLRRLPKRFRERLQNIAVVVEDWADDETLEDMGIEPPDTLYGLYRGTDLTRRDTNYGNVLPDVITIYQGPIQEDCDTRRTWRSWSGTPSSTRSATTSGWTTTGSRSWKTARIS